MTTTMTTTMTTISASLSPEQRQTYVGLWLMKKLDLPAAEGGMELPVVLPSELAPLDDHLQQLAVDGHLAIDRKKARYVLTKPGIAYLRTVIDEAADLVEEFDDAELPEVMAELAARKLDVFRARFLWGWFEGELDDLVLFQERRGVSPVERLWAFYLVGDDLWRELARDLEA
ncbi:MAG: hypothetical protein NT062_10265 [Proteobacteria bacterium]|nr:hypothetical protein [Pseudomonadota bacterium]